MFKKYTEENYSLDLDSQRLLLLEEEQHLCCTQNFLLKEDRYWQDVPRVWTEHIQKQRLIYKGGINGE